MKKPPIVLLDVDGVVNATATKIPTWIWPERTWHRQHVDGFQITWSDYVVDHINYIHTSGLAEIRWHATWQERAHDISDTLGLPKFPIQEAPEWPPTSAKSAEWFLQGLPNWWKYPAVVRLISEEKRRVMWIDDEIFDNLKAPARQHLKSLGKIVLVNPLRHTGLSSSDLRNMSHQLESWHRQDQRA